MALAAADTLGLDLATSWVVGDRMEDMGLASAVGASGIFLGPDGCDHHGLRAFPDLAAAADFILQHIDQGDGTAELSLLGRPPLTVRRKFPVESYGQARSYWRAYRSECQRAALSVDPQQIDRAVTVLLDAYTRSALIFACGNGGSAAIANHLQCDHVKGMRTATDLRPRAVSLSANIELIMAIANDLSYAEVFSYQLESQARPGDVLIAISSSGRSENIVRAVRWARDSGLHTIALTGFDGGEARRLAEISIHVRSANYGVVEDTHQAVMHAMAQFMRQSRMTPDTIARHSF
jgi:D-sedoheptulose 7-phosphate isomerase/D-glycero-D-manno-heptose 1,7-bisphosphate phosphatase